MRTSTFPTKTRRTLHLVDVESLLGTANPASGGVSAIARLYYEAAGVTAGDHVVIASSHHCAIRVWLEWDDSVRRILGSGPDGADRALLSVIEHENPAERYQRIVIGSGDGIFAEPAARLQASGAEVAVVTRASSLSRRLKMATKDVRYVGGASALSTVACIRRAA